MKVPVGGARFRDAMTDDLELLNNEYDLEIKLLNPNLKENAKEATKTAITEWTSKIRKLDERLADEQKKFTSDHNIKLQ